MSQLHDEDATELTLSLAKPIITSRTEQERIVTAWEASGQTQSAFARELGISANRLWYWIKRSRERAAAAESPAYFTECCLPSVGGDAPGAHVLQVNDIRGRNVTLTLSANVTPGFIATVLREMVQ